MRMCHLLGHIKPLGPCVRSEIVNIDMRMDLKSKEQSIRKEGYCQDFAIVIIHQVRNV